MEIQITITLQQILALPGEAAIALIEMSDPSQILVNQARDMEYAGKCRYCVLAALKSIRTTRIGCALCDRGDHQLGHAEACPNKPASSPRQPVLFPTDH